MGNYVIRRQSDGEVYLAHAGTASVPKTERPGHKYILRLLTRAGARYFYTPEQVRAFYNSVKAKASDPLGYNAQRDAMKKGMKVITTQGQENTAKWKVDKKPTAENKNNYERAKAANNYAQRDYYDARKAADKTIAGKLSSALRPKPSSDSQKSDQNGRSRGQSNLYTTDKYGNTYRPGVISEKPKGGMQSAEQGKEQSDKNDWKDNRPEGRKRNVTGKADPIQKGEGLKDKKKTDFEQGYQDERNYLNTMQKRRTDAYDKARDIGHFNSVTQEQKKEAWSIQGTMESAEKLYLHGKISKNSYEEILDKAEKELDQIYQDVRGKDEYDRSMKRRNLR